MVNIHRLWLGLSWLCLVQEIQSFPLVHRSRIHRKVGIFPGNRHDLSRLPLSASDDDNDSSANSVPLEPKSQMSRFISDFLQQQNEETQQDDLDSGSTAESSFTPSHLIALPVDACHELTIELESVQRAILYHAPVLVHACIAPAKMRMPLLYVKESSGLSDSSSETSRQLQTLVQQVVDRHVFGSDASPNDSSESVLTAQANPVLLEFAKLEIDGSNNAMLCTVAQPPKESDEDIDSTANSNGFDQLISLVQELTETLQQAGYRTMLPVDEAQQQMTCLEDTADNDATSGANVFRPRIPFMRLPPNWRDLVMDNYNRIQNRTTVGDEEDEDSLFIPSELGGNGISPILWGKWMDDSFAKGIRMRQVAIYPRRRSMRDQRADSETRLDEDSFYLPERVVDLPTANAAVTRIEKEFEEYQDKRFKELELQMEREFEAKNGNDDQNDGPPSATDTRPLDEDDPLLAKTRSRLEKMFRQETTLDEADIDEENIMSENAEATDDTSMPDEVPVDLMQDDILLETTRPQRSENPNAIDDWTREKIRNIVASRAKVQADQQLAIPKDKPAIHNNPVFNKYKEGTLVPKQPEPEPPRELPPFPSREHVIGFWKVVRSPTGFDVEEGDESRSDNLVLRVDGTISGGPILDQETRQKASGGTWKLLGTTAEDARIRIRLVIPPKKERILVMDGKIEKVSFSSDVPLARGTFGIPALELLAEKSESQLQDLLHCSGTVTMEDAVTGSNMIEIGKFSLTKLNTPTDPKQFTITVPKPVGFQD